MSELLRAEHLTKHFKIGGLFSKLTLHAVDDVSFSIGELEFQFTRLVQRIHINDGTTGAENRGDGNGVLENIRHHDGDAGATL